MSYTCQNCGAAADESSRLCKPASDAVESKFCGTPTEQVCNDQLSAMKYSCDSCGSVSADAGHLCSPSEIR